MTSVLLAAVACDDVATWPRVALAAVGALVTLGLLWIFFRA